MRLSAGWRDQAACRGLFLPGGDDPFYPEPGDSVRAAKRICRDCPVRRPCLVAGMEERHGIWGGLTRNERARLRRKAGRAKAA